MTYSMREKKSCEGRPLSFEIRERSCAGRQLNFKVRGELLGKKYELRDKRGEL